MKTAVCNPYKDLLRITAKARKEGLLKSYQGDLIRHDKKALKNHCGPYLWALRKDGTHLLTPDGACSWTNNKGAWDAMSRGEYGTARIYYSVDGRAPRKVSGSIPGKVAARWERACTKRFDPWTGKQK